MCNLFFQTCNVIFPLQLKLSHFDSLPRSVLLLGISLIGCCHRLRVCYLQVIIQIAHRIMQLFMKSMEEKISSVLLNITHTQYIKVLLLNCIEQPLQLGYIYWHLFHPSLLQFVKILHQDIK